jgi:ribosomal subunit interface protein
LSGFTTRKISALADITRDIDAAHVVLRLDPKTNPERRFSASVRLVVRGADVFARDTGHDLYATIGRVVDKLTNGLRARKGRLHSWHRQRDVSLLRNFAAA